MKKFIFGIVAIIVVGIIAVSLPKQDKEEDRLLVNAAKETIEDDDGFYTEPMSDKDIYFKADTVMPDNPVVNDMMDVANGYAILRAAYCDAELWFRFGTVINNEIGRLKTGTIKDADIRLAAEQYVRKLVLIMPVDTAKRNETDSLLWDQVWDTYKTFADKLSNRFSLSHYGKITEKDVQKYMDIEQFIPNYDSIYNLRKQQSEENERYLKLMAEQTPSFDRECLYTVEYAHQRRHEEPHTAIPMLEALMKSGKFSRYLHEVWRTWRVLKQMAQSPSRDGTILNREYNQMRYHCLNTILKQIVKNPKNIYAINDFCFLATYDNITRYSEFMFGNSAPLEHMMLFPEILEDSDENEAEDEAGESDS
ncbi:MAG: hypothetical protein IJ155_02085 [Prevotella sp.]|nr:hypothetical protein [Prevotella sp.]